MSIERVLTNGQVFLGGTFHALDIAISGSNIAALGARGQFDHEPGETVDAGGLYVFPGVIDSHFHCRAPSHPEREDFGTATTAAAAGGATTIIEMPISEPPTRNGQILKDRARLAESVAVVDIGFYASCATLRREDLESSVEAGALAFKGFMQQVPPGRESEFEGLCLPTNGELLEAFELLQEFDLPCVFHAEDEAMSKSLERRLRAAGRNDGPAHAAHRPDIVEATSVGTLLRLAERFGVHLHVPHVSSRMTVNLIRDAKERGVRVTAETCPQYLQFDRHALERLGPYAKCNPPFKEPHDVAALWDALRDGTIDTVASDHSPFTVDEKEAAWDNIWIGPPGFPGVEVLASYVIGAALDGRISWERVNELLFVNPARIFGLWPRKGVIQPGADADLMLYDPAAEDFFDHNSFRSKAKDTGLIWDGIERHGAVRATWLRGQLVFDGQEVRTPRNGGRLVTRQH